MEVAGVFVQMAANCAADFGVFIEVVLSAVFQFGILTVVLVEGSRYNSEMERLSFLASHEALLVSLALKSKHLAPHVRSSLTLTRKHLLDSSRLLAHSALFRPAKFLFVTVSPMLVKVVFTALATALSGLVAMAAQCQDDTKCAGLANCCQDCRGWTS